MADYTGKYFSQRDLSLLHSFNNELITNVMQIVVELLKVAPGETKTNIYGETDQTAGRYYFEPIKLACIIDRGDISSEDYNFGPDRKQTAVFKFQEDVLQSVNFYPQNGDLITFNERYYEIDNITQEQMIGGQPDKSWSIICNTHYTRFSKVNIIDRQN